MSAQRAAQAPKGPRALGPFRRGRGPCLRDRSSTLKGPLRSATPPLTVEPLQPLMRAGAGRRGLPWQTGPRPRTPWASSAGQGLACSSPDRPFPPEPSPTQCRQLRSAGVSGSSASGAAHRADTVGSAAWLPGERVHVDRRRSSGRCSIVPGSSNETRIVDQGQDVYHDMTLIG